MEQELSAAKARVTELEDEMRREQEDGALSQAFAVDSAVARAYAGTHDLFFHEDGSPALPDGAALPDAWLEKPFLRFARVEDSGDPPVGIPSRSYWAVANDQTGTAFFELVTEVMKLKTSFRDAAKALRQAAAFTGRRDYVEAANRAEEAIAPSSSDKPG